MKRRLNAQVVVAAALLLCQVAAYAQSSCDVSTAMDQKRKAERDRRMNGIDTRFEELTRANALMKACLENFPSYPTQLPSTAILQEAFKRVRQSTCDKLFKKAQDSYEAALQEAKNTAANATTGITNAIPSVPSIPSVVRDAGAATSGSQSNTGMLDTFKRLFQ